MTIFVGHLNERIHEEDLRTLFERYGPILSIDKKSTYAFIDYQNRECGAVAAHELDKTVFMGTTIRVEISNRERRDSGPPPGDLKEICYNCKTLGHIARNCPYPPRQPLRQNRMTKVYKGDRWLSNPHKKLSKHGIPRLRSSQVSDEVGWGDEYKKKGESSWSPVSMQQTSHLGADKHRMHFLYPQSLSQKQYTPISLNHDDSASGEYNKSSNSSQQNRSHMFPPPLPPPPLPLPPPPPLHSSLPQHQQNIREHINATIAQPFEGIPLPAIQGITSVAMTNRRIYQDDHPQSQGTPLFYNAVVDNQDCYNYNPYEGSEQDTSEHADARTSRTIAFNLVQMSASTPHLYLPPPPLPPLPPPPLISLTSQPHSATMLLYPGLSMHPNPQRADSPSTGERSELASPKIGSPTRLYRPNSRGHSRSSDVTRERTYPYSKTRIKSPIKKGNVPYNIHKTQIPISRTGKPALVNNPQSETEQGGNTSPSTITQKLLAPDSSATPPGPYNKDKN